MREGVPGGPRALKVGERIVETLVLVNGPMDSPTVPFPNPGRFSLRVVARTSKRILLGESKVLAFKVLPWVPRGQPNDATFAALLARHPGSPYLDWGRRAIALEKSHRIHNGRYPDTGEKYADIGQGHPLTPRLYRQLADEIRDERWGQFDEERLMLAAEHLEMAGDLIDAKDLWREITEQFPGSLAAERALSRIGSRPPRSRSDLTYEPSIPND
jgi:hypothetical protein